LQEAAIFKLINIRMLWLKHGSPPPAKEGLPPCASYFTFIRSVLATLEPKFQSDSELSAEKESALLTDTARNALVKVCTIYENVFTLKIIKNVKLCRGQLYPMRHMNCC
jgi:hypothetical protein